MSWRRSSARWWQYELGATVIAMKRRLLGSVRVAGLPRRDPRILDDGLRWRRLTLMRPAEKRDVAAGWLDDIDQIGASATC
jgi:hypothetical protein